MQREIPIVTTTDEAYLLNCCVAVYSIIKAANQDDSYKIFVLVTGLSLENRIKLEKLSAGQVQVKCVDISALIGKFNLQKTGQFPIQTYYRLFIPLIFPEYKKILYLDSDMCILRDTAELYGRDLAGHIAGVVKDVPCMHLEIHDRELGEMDCRRTFNSGVLLLDTEAFEREQIREKCLRLLSEDYKREKRRLIYADNDALNIVLYDRCQYLDYKWNFQWQYMWRMEEIYEDFRDIYKKVSDNPYIIHYAGGCKPWTDPEYPLADVFWQMAKETSVYEEIVFKALMDVKVLRTMTDSYRVFLFPYAQIPYGSKIAIYGAGTVGQAFYMQLQLSKYAEVTLWVDRKWENISDKLPVENPSFLRQQDRYHYLLIAIERKEIAHEIFDELLQQGISGEKIVWAQYKK